MHAQARSARWSETAAAVLWILLLILLVSAAPARSQDDPEIVQTLSYQRLLQLNEATIGAASLSNGFMKMSADGSTIVFSTSNKKVYTVGTSESDPTLVFDYSMIEPPATQEVFVDISANGSRIVWTDKADEIYTAVSDGSGITRLATEFDDPFYPDPRGPTIRVPPHLTADGSQVIFANTIGGGDAWADIGGVWRASTDGSSVTQIFSYRQMAGAVFGTDGSEYNPGVAFARGFSVSDNGQRIVFATRPGFGPEAIVAYDGAFRTIWDGWPGDDQLVISGNGGMVAFSPAQGDFRGSVLTVPFIGGDPVEVSTEGVFAHYDFSVDGSFLGFNTLGATLGRTPLTILTLADGSHNDVITVCPGNGYLLARQSSFSANAHRVAFVTGTSPQELWIADVGGSPPDGNPVLVDPDFDPSVITTDRTGSSTFSVGAFTDEGDIQLACFDALGAEGDQGAYIFGMPFAGGGQTALVDDGSAGDAVAGDGVYTRGNVVSRLNDTPPGEYTIRFYARTADRMTAVDVAPLELTDDSVPVIDSIDPAEGTAGTVVVIEGENFDPDPEGNVVLFDSVRAVVLSASPTRLEVLVPAGTDLGEVEVIVSRGELPSEPEPFTVTVEMEFVVNTDDDAPDFDLSDGVCDTDRDESGNQCSLQAALQNADATPELDLITFNVPGGSSAVITGGPQYIGKVYVAATPVLIDGTTQGGGMMQIYGCLQIRGGDSTIRGLVINRCPSTAVHLTQKGNNVVEQNYFGTDVSGTRPVYPWDPDDFWSNFTGIWVSAGSQFNTIRNNLISNSASHAIRMIPSANLDGRRPKGAVIEDNLIGTDTSGTVAIPNQGSGIIWQAADNVHINNNLISASGGDGIVLSNWADESPSLSAEVVNNFIGTDVKGEEPLGNGGDGIVLSMLWGSPVIGDLRVDVRENLISANGGYGIRLRGVHGNQALGPNGLITKNTIGLNRENKAPLGNEAGGMFISGWGNTRIIQNTISGNGGHGISSGGPDSHDRVFDFQIERNWIGLNDDWIGFGNDGDGLRLSGQRLDIRVNAIGGNSDNGIYFDLVKNSRVSQSWIGTGPGSENLANGLAGIRTIHPTGMNEIGGLRTQNTFSANRIGYNEEVGILAEYVRDDLILGNWISDHPIGIELVNSVVSVVNNRLWANETGILSRFVPITRTDGMVVERPSIPSRIDGNSVSSSGPTTGIRLENSFADIRGNTVSDESGDGIRLLEESRARITQNNLVGSAGFAVNNTGQSTMVDAGGNWWGDANGPSGSGPGAGDAVSPNVDFSDWRSGEVGITVSGGLDTLRVRSGSSDTLWFGIRNWSDPSGFVDIRIDDGSGFVTGPASGTVQLNDSVGASVAVALEVPLGKVGVAGFVKVTAADPLDTESSGTDSVLVLSFDAAGMVLSVAPDSAEIEAGDQFAFSVAAFDSEGSLVDIDAVWSATGGVIDDSGVFTAGDEAGVFEVVATDPSSGSSATAVVVIGTPVSTEESADLPTEYRLEGNYPNPFNPVTTIDFSTPVDGVVRLAVFDILGREVKLLVDDRLGAGRHRIRFEAGDLASGVYLYRLDADGFAETRRMVLLK